ncbi:lipopolysaccharide-responsive and beige-like anchor protein isoform X2 [Myripristis murdjan]|uniref:lipopolysaccharide-responsive and beige-like anchor protein isoform X2 n=1 Tax=Myripristis murdjan TaxID=586833 RepID=UPI001175E45A|nr:lipopolysaccharide-responsive and beige-like anchor protein isoform X2 [Myripristis murdjan]
MASEETPGAAPPGDGKDGKTSTMAINPGIPIRGIRMKFAVLAGLVEVGEVSNRDIVETVFNLLVGGQFDLEMNFIIQEPESIVCMVELLDQCEPTCQAEVWSIFTAILKKSVRNLQACTDVGLIQLVLQRISSTDSMIADLLVDMLGVLASYSITVKELKLFFSKLQGEKGQWPPHAVKLLSVLKYMAHRNGPDSFFSFPGKSAAAIALPPIAKWPYQNGFTFHTWLRMDPLNNINVDKDKPYLYCFRTSKGLGYSAHFVGGCLIVTSLKSKGKGFQHCVKYDFKPQKWYMVTIVHVYNRWKNSEISCYVNGELASYGDITWFVNTSDTFDKCFLGSSETADANRVFCGQMGAVYLFGEALSAAQILAIYQLGPGYKGTFKYKAESDLLFAEHHKTLLYDGKLSSSIAFSYNPRATDAQLCLESSPKDNASIFVHSPHALMLQDVKAVVTHSVQSGVHSIGGVQVLFPLFAQLDYCQPNSHELDTSVCCTLLSFVMELLKNSVAMQEQVLACKGFLVIGYALEKSSKVHVTRPVLDIVLAFARHLSNLQNGVLLLKQLCDHILFNPAIWIHAPAKVQLTLYTYVATEFISTVTIYNAIRRVGTVLQIMHTLKYYYWVVNPQDRSGVVPKGLDGPRPNQKEIHSLRAFLLLFVKQLIMKDHGVKEDELQGILNYLLTMHEDDNLMDVLQLLVALMSEHPGSMVQAFDQRNGIRVIYKLLASKSEGIRVQALKVLGYFLKHLPPKRKSEVMLGHSLFSLLTERLVLHSNQFSMTTYNVLFEILTEQICTQVIHKQHPDPDSTVKILNPQILKVMAALLKNSPASPESMEVRRVFLSDMIKLFNNSRENRRSLLQCSVWQEWMLSLCFINPRNSEEQKITEMVYAIFRILLYHAIKYEWGGWRVWVDTLSITHSKVTFEQHKENLSRMFRQYRRESAGSVSTVRTISGASQTSEILECTNGPHGEETAPSTVIELTVDGLSQKPPASASTITSSSPAATGEREQTSITVSNILARDEEEDQRLGQESSRDGSDDGKETEATVIKTTDQEEVGRETSQQGAMAEPFTDKNDNDDDTQTAASAPIETDSTKNPEIDGAKVTETSEDTTTMDDVKSHESDINKDESLTSMTEDSLNETDTGLQVVSEPEVKNDQMSSDTSGCLDNSVVGGASVFNEDLVDVSSVSDQVRPSDADESQEESSYVSAVAGEEGEEGKLRGDEEVEGKDKQDDQEGQELKTVEKHDDGEQEVKIEEKTKESEKKEESVLEGHSLETPPPETPEKNVKETPKDEQDKQSSSVTDTPAANQPPTDATSPSTAQEATAASDSASSAPPNQLSETTGTTTEEAQTKAPDSRTPSSDTQRSADSATRTKEIKIARLDVSNVALDTERLELKGTATTDISQGQPAAAAAAAAAPAAAVAGASGQSREGSTSGPRSTMFRIPEFRWSHMHQRLLTDLLFSIETDVQMWRSHSTKTVLDFVNSSENVVFVHNSVHLISQVVDNLIMACGGILPLLSAATSSSHELENIEPSQGLAVEASVTFLQRLINLVDVLIFASSLNFNEIEAEKNMSSGGILRQCLRLVCAMAVRNCLECQQHAHFKSGTESSARSYTAMPSTLLGTAKAMPAQSPVDVVTGGMSPVRDVDRLLQDMDINRLRAVVFRDIDSKQAQFLALAVVYFISVLMVSKYRDILEPQNDKKHPQRSQSARSTDSGAISGGLDVENGVSLRRYDSGIGDDHTSAAASEAESSSSGMTHGPDAISEALSTLSSEVRPAASSDKGKNVKDILRSLVSTPADDIMVDPSLLPPAFLGSVGDPARESALQFRSFDRSVVIAPKKAGTMPSPGPSSVATPIPAATAASVSGGTPINSVAVVSAGDASQSTSAETAAAGGQVPASTSLPSVPSLSPMTQHTAPNMSISERLEHALEKAAPLLREIFVDFAPFLSRTLLGSHGQELLIEGTSLVCMKSSSSVVELVMLLCSQEWQNSIQKNAGLAFIELVNEGRLLSHTMKDHLVRVANEAEFILSRQRAEDIHKHAEFESYCAQYAAEKRDEEKMCDHLIRAAKYRDHVTATQLIQKIVNILTDKHGAWGNSSISRPREFWRLDYWEDDLRRRRRFIRNPFGSTHSEATLKAAAEHAADITASEEDILKGKQSIRSQALGNQNSESELLLDGDDDTLSSLEDKELENLTGPVNLSTAAQLVAPAVVVKGTLSITASELYFEVDEEEPGFKAIDPKILAYTEGLHGKWLFTEIRAIFSRRYLLQNTALEIFMANRTAVMFNLPDAATVKKVVHCLPRVGVGTNFGLPQTRRISLASPKQLFKASNMTQRWQRREISNFEYLIFLNTISGRTYNDLNQYPVFPWVITNYESEELDLTLPSNFRDLSKPIGALNPKRAAFFSDRFESWEDEQVPKFHYGTHYSTSSFTQMWLLRIEPFTTFFLNFQGGKFDHADRTFSSVSRAWRNCQRDTSDVKELIPEFFYLPEMFVNSNNYNLGVMEDGTVVSDVELPPWAKSPEEFVRINRLALESEFVSCQLHQWIDLIFGYKQQGPEATRALNVFYYLTYEGAVNLSSISDPMLREAVESQIRSFGQTPCQLLIEPHPPRSSAMQVTPLMFTEQMQQDVIMVLKFPSNSPVTHVAANTQTGLTSPAIITVTASRLFAVNKWHGLTGHQSSTVQDQQYQLPVEIDPLIANNVGSHRRQISDLLDQSIQISSHCFIITADNRFILLCGFWDKSFRVYSTDSGKLTQIVFGHRDVVTCLARSESYIGGDCYVLSGSRDATLLLWYWNGKHSSIGESPGTEFVTPRAILTGHDCEVTCASVCAELGLVISACKEGPCLIHSMNGDLLRTLEGPEHCTRPRLIQSSSEGHCVIYYEKGQFCLFSVNGKLLGHMEVDENIKAMLLSRDGQYLLIGGDGGVVSVWQVHNLKQLFTYPGCDAGIRAMAMSHDQRCIITGMASGSIVLFYNDFNRWHHEYQTRY